MDNTRNCYCKKDEIFCGKCCFCGKDGHIRHAPAAPATAAFCDDCFEKETNRVIKEYEDSVKREQHQNYLKKTAMGFLALCGVVTMFFIWTK